MSRWPLPARLLVGVVGLIVVTNGLLVAATAITGDKDPGGPAASTFGTDGDGIAALAELIETNGRDVVRLGRRVHLVELGPDSTLVVARPDLLAEEEVEAIEGFLDEGGRVVTTGLGPLITLAGAPVTAWSPAATASLDARPIMVGAETSGIGLVRLGGRGRWDQTGTLVPLLAADGDIVAAAGGSAKGNGRIVAIADPTMWSNELLAEADNAAFALAAIGDGAGPVYFAEALHGFSGWRALPPKWLWAAGLGALAGAMLIWSRLVRFGPADRPQRELAPARIDYAQNMGRLVIRTDRRERAARPLQKRLREHLTKRVGLDRSASNAQLFDAVSEHPADAHAAKLAADLPTDDVELLELGRAAAAAERRSAGIGRTTPSSSSPVDRPPNPEVNP